MIVMDLLEVSELHRMLREIADSRAMTRDAHWARQRANNGTPLTADEASRIRVAHAAMFPMWHQQKGAGNPRTLVVDTIIGDEEENDRMQRDAVARSLRGPKHKRVIP